MTVMMIMITIIHELEMNVVFITRVGGGVGCSKCRGRGCETGEVSVAGQS